MAVTVDVVVLEQAGQVLKRAHVVRSRFGKRVERGEHLDERSWRGWRRNEEKRTRS